MSVDRSGVEKIVEQELSSIFLRALKAAEREGKPYVKEALQMLLVVIEDRREERERARADEPRR